MTCGVFIDLISFVILIKIGINHYFSYMIGYILGTIANLILLRYFFHKPRFKLFNDLLLTFVLNGSTAIAGLGLYWAVINFILSDELTAKLASMMVTFIFNYIIRIVFFQK